MGPFEERNSRSKKRVNCRKPRIYSISKLKAKWHFIYLIVSFFSKKTPQVIKYRKKYLKLIAV